jgi:hypothetical protein
MPAYVCVPLKDELLMSARLTTGRLIVPVQIPSVVKVSVDPAVDAEVPRAEMVI